MHTDYKGHNLLQNDLVSFTLKFHLYLQVPEKLLLSACHLMVSITSTVRPVFLVNLPAVQNIFNLITAENQTNRLPQEVNSLFFCFFAYLSYFQYV